MKIVSYGKCQQCGKYGMLHGFWYSGESLTPDYLCSGCMEEFDDAMAESYFWTMHARALDDPDWDADAALEAFKRGLKEKKNDVVR